MTPDLLQLALECNGAGLIVMQGKVNKTKYFRLRTRYDQSSERKSLERAEKVLLCSEF